MIAQIVIDDTIILYVSLGLSGHCDLAIRNSDCVGNHHSNQLPPSNILHNLMRH